VSKLEKPEALLAAVKRITTARLKGEPLKRSAGSGS